MDPIWIIAALAALALLTALWTAREIRGATLQLRTAMADVSDAAKQAAVSAQAARDQVLLQRPLPLVVVDWRWEMQDGAPQVSPRQFELRNIGNSTAFDVELTPLSFQATEAGVTEAWALNTERVLYILQNSSASCTHIVSKDRRNVFDNMPPLPRFIAEASRALSVAFVNGAPVRQAQATMPFTISYSTADGRQITCDCVIKLDFIDKTARVSPVSSWLPPRNEG